MKSLERTSVIERVATRYPQLALELYSAPLDKSEKARKLVRKALGRKSKLPIGTRSRSILHLVAKPANALGADVEQWLQNKLTNETGVEGSMSLIGDGKEHLIYKAELDGEHNGTYALKMDKESIDRTPEEMEQRISELESVHDQIETRYQAVDGLIMPVRFEVRKFPYRGKEAIGRRQPYLEGLRDIFQDFSDDELSDLFRNDPSFRESFIAFADITQDVYDKTRQVADVYGSGNLCVATNPDSTNRLVLVDDSRDFDLSNPTEREMNRKHAVEAKLKRIKELSEMAKGVAA